jgi:antiphage defense system Thoeris ThsB-like protein
MARRVFFSFHYQRDLWRANVVRNSGAIEGVSAAGFHDASFWEETKRKGDVAVKKLIRSGLRNTIVTVVLIGAETANRRYLTYEVEQSVARGNGIFGIRINNIKDRDGRTDPPGPVPSALTTIGAKVYTWEYGKLGEWVEKAYKSASAKS